MPAEWKTEAMFQSSIPMRETRPGNLPAVTSPPRVLIAGVGYQFLRDMSAGPALIELMAPMQWPEGVEFEDLSYGPVGVMHNLDARLPYHQIIFIAGIKRNRQPGAIYSYRWEAPVATDEAVHECMTEAIGGVISLDNLLVIASYFKKLPDNVTVIEIEAEEDTWGEGFTPAVAGAFPAVIADVRARLGG